VKPEDLWCRKKLKIRIKIFREEATSAGLHVDPLSWSNLNLEMLGFSLWMRENRRPQRKTHGARREPTTNSTQRGSGSEPGPHWRGLSPLCHLCFSRTTSDIEYLSSSEDFRAGHRIKVCAV